MRVSFDSPQVQADASFGKKKKPSEQNYSEGFCKFSNLKGNSRSF
jgi:hypothetical protein